MEPSQSATSSTTSPTGSKPADTQTKVAIGVGSAAGIILIGVISGLTTYVCRRRLREKRLETKVDPFPAATENLYAMLREELFRSLEARRHKAESRQALVQDLMLRRLRELAQLHSMLGANTGATSPQERASGGAEVDRFQLLRQMEHQRQRIEQLQNQLQSPWAQGLSDEGPPEYTATVNESAV